MPFLKTSRWLDHLLPRPQPRVRVKPREMLYTVEETPPWGIVLALGGQHAFLALMLSVYAVIAAQSIGLDGAAIHQFVATCLLIAALGTLLQASPTRFGSGHLAVHIPTPVTLGTFVAVAGTLGLGAAAGGMLIAALVVMLMSRGLSRLRPLFPPEITGVVVSMLGLSLVEGGVARALGLTDFSTVPQASAALVSGLTLTVIIGLSIWGSPRWRNFAMLIGVAIGYGLTWTLGLDDTATRMSAASPELLGFPVADIPMPALVLAAVVPILIAEIVSAVDGIGGLVTLDRMNDADWRRADLPMTSRGILAQGITVLLSGLTGTLSTGLSSANIGLAFASGVAARRVAFIAGLLLLLAAFLPPISALIANTPSAVVGAVLIYTAGYLIVSGMELILSRLLNPRRLVVVGMAMVAGTAVMVIPSLSATAPEWAQPLLASPLAVATILAVMLNLILRLGIKQRASFVVPEPNPIAATQEFCESQGAIWGARRLVIARVAHAIGEAIDVIGPRRAPATEPMRLEAAFDELFLEFTLLYPGTPLPLNTAGASEEPSTWLEQDDEDFARSLDSLPFIMLTRLADQVRGGTRGPLAYLTLRFEH